MTNEIDLQTCILEGSLSFNGEVVLTYKIEYPVFCSENYTACIEKLNWFYKHKAMEYKRYCETTLLNMAIQQYQGAVKNDFPIRVFDAVQVFTVTYAENCIISICFENYQYLGGAHGSTIRHSETWNINKCRLIKIEQIVKCPPNYKVFLLNQIEEQIKKNTEPYFENYAELIRKTFNKDSFFCTPDGIVFYYGQYDIAPYSSGIREFFIPYSNCVLNPSLFC